jgi:hypothetical protein
MSDTTTSSTTETARETAAAVKDEATSAAQDVAGTAKQGAGHVAHEARNQARQLGGQSRDELVGQAGTQQAKVAEGLRSLGSELRSMAVGSEANGPATDLVREAASRVGSVAGWLENREPGDVVEQLRTFARRRPGTFLAAAAVAGLVGGRLTRAAVAEHRDDSSGSPEAQRPSTGTPATSTGVTAGAVNPGASATTAPAPVSDYPGHGTTTGVSAAQTSATVSGSTTAGAGQLPEPSSEDGGTR